MEEYLDTFNEDEECIGKAPRSEVHRMGYWHRTFQCWFTFEENGKQYLLFQKRCENKDTYPLLFDITSAGHLSTGEDLQQGVREIKEELGVDIEFNELLPIGIVKQKKIEINLKDYEFAHVFLFRSKNKITDYKLQKEELTALVKLELKSAIELFNNKVNKVKLVGITFDGNNDYKDAEFEATKESFVPHGDKYYNLVFSAAEKLLSQKNI
ncbi:NUDIX hydrolase [Clostridium omnivorum]|uniref:Nudix hydrolase n=1 Tax=Clostridium omnivorum TaxID=1604902 RepID=A0ABQ5N0Z0_9CLOT|nr:NUDIX domain-containing protein [Clostridium sp. E14]GLC28868.1 putative Nudix hydrolase [Clostridium sp. E14]